MQKFCFHQSFQALVVKYNVSEDQKHFMILEIKLEMVDYTKEVPKHILDCHYKYNDRYIYILNGISLNQRQNLSKVKVLNIPITDVGLVPPHTIDFIKENIDAENMIFIEHCDDGSITYTNTILSKNGVLDIYHIHPIVRKSIMDFLNMIDDPFNLKMKGEESNGNY